jgi:hypothetical protein
MNRKMARKMARAKNGGSLQIIGNLVVTYWQLISQ